MTPSTWLIYGTGVFAQQLAQELTRIGHQPVIAGANEQAVLAMAESCNCQYQVFSLDKPYALKQQLENIEIVLDASDDLAAPYSHFIEACLQAGCHYVALQPWPNQPADAEAWQQQAVAKGLVLVFASGFVPQALALWQANASTWPESFIIDDNTAQLLPLAAFGQKPKNSQGLLLCKQPAIYWRAGRKTFLLAAWAKCKARLLQVLHKPQPPIAANQQAQLTISAIAQGALQQKITVNTQQLQQLQLKTAVFLLESLLACKVLPGVYSAFEVVDNNPEQAQEFLDFIFTDPRANTHD